MKNFITIFGLLTISLGVYGQNVDFKSGNFKDDKDGYKNATDNIDIADDFYDMANEALFATQPVGLNYEIAIKHYLVAQAFNPNNAELNFKLGVCFANSTFPFQSIKHIKRAFELDPEVDPFMPYYLGYVNQLEGNYSEALKLYKQFEGEYRKADNFSKFVTQRKKECTAAKILVGEQVRAWVDNVPALNSEYNDYAPSISTDGSEIIFSSDRPNQHEQNQAGGYDEDIYASTYVAGKWASPKGIVGNVNTDGDDVANNLSFDGTKMLLHRDVDGQKDIFESQLNGLNWSTPVKLPFAISSEKSNDVFAAYSPDGYSIYFGRDNANRSNGTDIVYSSMQSKLRKDFMAATRVGEVNSKFNDGPIYLHIDDERMFICSQGLNTMGGYDIFVSEKKQGQWTEPKNMGYPINTPYDDFFFATTANGKFAFIASNRAGGMGGYDIYKVTFWGEEKKPEMASEDYLLASILNPIKDNTVEEAVVVNRKSFTVFKGKTIDALTKEAVEASIEITDNETGKIIETFTTNSATGKFIITLASGKNYGIAVKAEGYLFHSENFDLPKGSADNLVDKTVELKNIAIGSKIALRNIFFDVGKSTLRPESNAELDRLVKLMQDVPSLKIEIAGHTDNTGSAGLNKKLSQARADAVVRYLTSKGIAANRMTAEGYGDSQPIASNASADGRQQNRRTEFEIKSN